MTPEEAYEHAVKLIEPYMNLHGWAASTSPLIY
jgi:hypothetical protein